MNILETLRERRSVRRFKPDRPDRALIEQLIGVAVLAPSASNKQPWRFFVVDERSMINQLSELVEKQVALVATHISAEFSEAFRVYGEYFVRFREAPVVIVPAFRPIEVLSNLVDNALKADDINQIRIMEFNSGIVSTSLAVQNLMLFAHSIGLGTSCMTGPLVALDGIKSLLKIPEGWQVACFLPIGYPDENPAAPQRKDVAAVIRWVKGSQ